MNQEARSPEALETDLRLADRQARELAERAARIPLLRCVILEQFSAEADRAARHGATFASLHEAWAVLLEELDEVWDITRQKRRDRSALELQKEFIQIGAMAIKALESMESFVGGSV